jgi:Glycosyl hydrolase family 26
MAKRTLFSLLTAVLAAIGAFVYFTPDAPPPEAESALRAAQVNADNASFSRAKPPKMPATSPRAEAEQRRARSSARAKGKSHLDGPAGSGSRTRARTVVYRDRTVVRTVTKAPQTPASASPTGTDLTSPPAPSVPACDLFTWQQDAQAAYVVNLADPFGLDGPPGPSDDDGIACSLLPVDPSRPPSTPAGAKPPPPPAPEGLPQTPPLDAVLNPQLNYFGVSTPQTPYDFKEFRIFAAAATKLPNMDMFFVGWDKAFPRDQVVALWRRGALPVVSWEPRPTVQAVGPDSDNTVADGYTLASIIDGSHDKYIDRFATAVRELGLPVGIRFAHEMNGNWFPWSEETNGNHRGEYVEAWQHVHDRFTKLGATNAIWIWSPNVITARPSVSLAPLYPGDDYVDWVGIVGYYRRVYYDTEGQPKAPTFDNTYASTLEELRGVAQKPILLTEVGATEIGGNKPAWIASLFEGIAANPDIIGFIWFDHSVNGTDWRIESSSAATSAFATGIADPRYGAGKVYVPK